MKPGLNLNNEKYSNVDIFAKRMRERIKLHSALNSNRVKSFHSMNKSKNRFDLTLSTFASTKRTIFSGRRNKKKINDFNKMIQYNSDINLNNKLYLTDTPFIENKLSSQSNISILSKKDEIYYSPLYKKSPNYLLHLFQKDKNDFIESKNRIRNPKISNKIKQYHKTEKIKDYINKTRNVQLLKYSTTIQKDRNSTFKEVHNNELEKLNGLISSYNQSKKLFNEEFLNKFNEYVKIIIKRREIERGINEQLIEQIFQHKNDIAIIESKIRKVEFEKNNIIKWIYFQICLNEQKLKVPFYYKIIIEESEEDFKNFINEEKKEKTNESNLNTPTPTRNNSKSNSIKREFNSQSSRKKVERSETRKTINSNNKSITERFIKKKYNLNSLLKKITKEEMKRIRDYRYSIIFVTVDDFIFQFNQLEKKNLNLISEYNSLSKQLLQLRKEQDLMITERKKEMDYTLNLIEIKENELNDIKNKNKCLLEQLENITNETNEKYKNEKRLYLKNKLYLSIISLFKKFSQMNYNYCEEILKNKRTLTEEEILFILQKIESQIDYLNNKFKIHKIKNEEQMKILINNIEKKHKMEKTKKQREEEEDKNDKLKEKIEKRKNRVYLYPRRKIEKYFSFQNKSIKFKLDEDIIKEPSFDDYI